MPGKRWAKVKPRLEDILLRWRRYSGGRVDVDGKTRVSATLLEWNKGDEDEEEEEQEQVKEEDEEE